MAETMRAMQHTRPGGPQVLELVHRRRPQPLPTEVLVRVAAAGVNPVDWKTRAGGGISGLLGEPPFTLGWDVAGVVEEVGFGVTRFRPGDRVLGMPRFPHLAGGYADYLTAPSRHFVRTPDGLDDHSAAGLPLAGLTAWQILVDTADLQPGQRVLVHGAAGGVGHLLVQVAKARGAWVIGTARQAKHDFLTSLGTDECIDYSRAKVADEARNVDVMVDLIGGDTASTSLPSLRPGGLLVVGHGLESVLADAAAKAQVRTAEFLVEPDPIGLAALTALIDAQQLRVEVEHVLPLEEAARAHQIGEAGRTRGKIVLSVAAV